MDEAEALRRFRDWLRVGEIGPDGRLPPERALAPRLGLSRAELRRALAVVTEEGALIRHVGRGTFLVERLRAPPAWTGALPAAPGADGLPDLTMSASPRALLQARIVLEPPLAGLAVLNATGRDVDEIRDARRALEQARTWPSYAEADRRLHRAVAVASGNAVLLGLFDTLVAAGQSLDWGRLGQRLGDSPVDHPTHVEHAAIVDAIASRDRHAAVHAARHHVTIEASALLGESG